MGEETTEPGALLLIWIQRPQHSNGSKHSCSMFHSPLLPSLLFEGDTSEPAHTGAGFQTHYHTRTWQNLCRIRKFCRKQHQLSRMWQCNFMTSFSWSSSGFILQDEDDPSASVVLEHPRITRLLHCLLHCLLPCSQMGASQQQKLNSTGLHHKKKGRNWKTEIASLPRHPWLQISFQAD